MVIHEKVSSLTPTGWSVACNCGWQLLLPAESGCVAAGDRAYHEHLTSGRSTVRGRLERLGVPS